MPAKLSPAQRRQREREELRSRILNAARELFATKGYEGVTIRDIAERISYTPPTVYTHFKDKEALIRELCDQDFLALRQAFDHLGEIPDPLERLYAIGQAYARFALSHPHHYTFMFLTPHKILEPDSSSIRRGDPEQDAYAFLHHHVKAAIAAGCLRPECQNPSLISQVLWSAIHGLVSLFIHQPDRES
jgi:AcrR family transcriptional regulator